MSLPKKRNKRDCDTENSESTERKKEIREIAGEEDILNMHAMWPAVVRTWLHCALALHQHGTSSTYVTAVGTRMQQLQDEYCQSTDTRHCGLRN